MQVCVCVSLVSFNFFFFHYLIITGSVVVVIEILHCHIYLNFDSFLFGNELRCKRQKLVRRYYYTHT